MRIVFYGTPHFAVATLDAIHRGGYEVAAVVTAPDKPAGRGRQVKTSPVKEYAVTHNIPVLQPTNLKSEDFTGALQNINPDVQVVVAFRMLPEVVWAMPLQGTFNIHASLLPQYRGAAPINHAIINGENETGVSSFFLQKEIDTGAIIARRKVAIHPADNAGTLHDKLMAEGADLALETLHQIQTNTVQEIPQEQLVDKNTPLTKAPKIFKNDCRIDWDQPVEDIYNFIRGLSPSPASFTYLSDNKGFEKMIKVFKASKEFNNNTYETKSLLTNENTYLKVVCPDGCIYIEELQMEGKKRMDIASFLKGVPVDETWVMK